MTRTQPSPKIAILIMLAMQGQRTVPGRFMQPTLLLVTSNRSRVRLQGCASGDREQRTLHPLERAACPKISDLILSPRAVTAQRSGL